VTVEFLYWEGCPSHEEARELLEEVLRERGLDAQVEVRHVATREEAAELRFPGSPTIVGAAEPASLSCRIYHLPDGRVSPIPSRKQLEEALA
jgi:hypothetical protein